MQIKLNKNYKDYKYLVMFDLASKISGVCLWDIQLHKVIRTDVIRVMGAFDLGVYELYTLIDTYFRSLSGAGINMQDVLVYKEAMPSQLRGGSSTVQTFVALARSHAVLDLYVSTHGIDVYDYVGIYPITTHAYLKKLNGWENDHSVEKKDVQDYVRREYNLNLTADEADAVLLAKTFIEVKWNKDIAEAIRDIKRHKKELKLDKAKQKCDENIDILESLKNNY